jgi:hypothetical protein
MEDPFELADMFEGMALDLTFEQKIQLHQELIENAEPVNLENEINKVQATLSKYGLEFDRLHFTSYTPEGEHYTSRRSEGMVDIRLTKNWRSIVDPTKIDLIEILLQIEKYDRTALSNEINNTMRAFNTFTMLPNNQLPLDIANQHIREFLGVRPNMILDPRVTREHVENREMGFFYRARLRKERPSIELWSDLWTTYQDFANNDELVRDGYVIISQLPQIVGEYDRDDMGSRRARATPWKPLFRNILDMMVPVDRYRLYDFIKMYHIAVMNNEEPRIEYKFDPLPSVAEGTRMRRRLRNVPS